MGCLEMIASGTTCFVDGYFYQDETVLAAHQAGLRGLVAQGVIDFPAPGVENPKENLSTAKTFIEKWKGFSELIRPGIFCHSPVTCSEETLRRAWALSEAFDLPFQIHLSETSDVMIIIYNANGQIVRRLELGTVVSGYYTSKSKAAYWDGKNEAGEEVASGIYFYTIQAGDFTATRKMTITR